MVKTLKDWPFVGKFCHMTKEMSSSNRMDTLTDALYYYAENKINKLGNYYYQNHLECINIT